MGTLTITPPKEFDPEWGRDGIQEKPPAGQGSRTYWMNQVGASAIGSSEHLSTAVLVLAGWTVVFGALVVRRYRSDSARV